MHCSGQSGTPGLVKRIVPTTLASRAPFHQRFGRNYRNPLPEQLPGIGSCLLPHLAPIHYAPYPVDEVPYPIRLLALGKLSDASYAHG